MVQESQELGFYFKSKGSLGKEVTYLIYISKTLILAAVLMDNRETRMEAESFFRVLLL